MKKQLTYFILFAFVALIASCSIKTNRKVLSIFFDGVPVESPADSSSVNEKIIKKDSANNNNIINEVAVYNENIHPPYKDGNCSVCHNSTSSGMLNGSIKEVCNTCHEDLSKKFAFIHGPVAAGYCTACHKPHVSELPHLLVSSRQSLCLNCHDQAVLINDDTHNDIGEADCIYCHIPHGGKDRFFLNYYQNKDH